MRSMPVKQRFVFLWSFLAWLPPVAPFAAGQHALLATWTTANLRPRPDAISIAGFPELDPGSKDYDFCLSVVIVQVN
jgi:hypothetical protein